MDNLLIRKAKSKDLEELLKMNIEFIDTMGQYYKEKNKKKWNKNTLNSVKKALSRRLRNKKETVLIAEKQGQIVGYAGGSIEKEYYSRSKFGSIDDIFIKKEFRRSSIGEKLLSGLIKQMLRRGAREFNASVAVRNKASRKLLMKFGFYEHSFVYTKHI